MNDTDRATVSAVPARFVGACALVAYALVALVLRLVVARDFFLAGQAMIAGPKLPLALDGLSYTLTLPAAVRHEALQAFAAQFAAVPMAPTLIAYGFAYAEFLLPVCLLLGFATRFAALILLALTVLLQLYVEPAALWTRHVYWFAILLVLITCGAGGFSLDALVRRLFRR